MRGNYGCDTHTRTDTQEVRESAGGGRVRLTVEFSGRVFQTVDSLLMVQAN